MRIVIASDSFKESLSALDVCKAIAGGVHKAVPDADVVICPMADGGEGTVHALVTATGGRMMATAVRGPLGDEVRADWGMLGSDSTGGSTSDNVGGSTAPTATAPTATASGQTSPTRPASPRSASIRTPSTQTPSTTTSSAGSPLIETAVIEMAAASGLPLVVPDRRDPTRTSTYGTGQLVSAALDQGARRIILGIGGSATNDGGTGCAQAVGVRFLDADGVELPAGMSGGWLHRVHSIDVARRDARLTDCRIRVACDVDNPLCGPRGASAVYGPQKGATPEMVRLLDDGLAHLADVIERDLGRDVRELPGAGAAGGLGAGLVAFLNAELRPGIDIVTDAIGLADRIAGADLVVTGEGRLDAQSMMGKVVYGVGTTARRAGIPVIAICGSIGPGAEESLDLISAYFSIVNRPMTLAAALSNAEDLLQETAMNVMRAFARSD